MNSSPSGASFRLRFKESSELYLAYWVKFEDGFDFILGGKLPGLSGSANLDENKKVWKGRLMWRQGGDIEFYMHWHKESDAGGQTRF